MLYTEAASGFQKPYCDKTSGFKPSKCARQGWLVLLILSM